MKRKRAAPPKVQPWPGSVFALKIKWEDWGADRHLWVFLERRVPGKFGRLEATHAIVPKGRKKNERATLFGSARYRRGTLDSARELFRSAGVPERSSCGLHADDHGGIPLPDPQRGIRRRDLQSAAHMALGDRYKELSYHRTGVPELTEDDRALIGQCLAALEIRGREDPADGPRFLKFVLGRGPL